MINDKNEIGTFALDRIIKIKPLLKTYLTNNYFEPGKYFYNLIGTSRKKEDKTVNIKTKVAKYQVPCFKTKPLHHTQQIKDNKDGSALMSYSLVINYELKQLLLSYSDSI